MKNMRSVYKKINNNYKNIDIDFNEKKDMLIIKKNNLRIEADSDMVELFKDNKSINHYHPKDYNDLFGCISLYLNDSASVQRRVKRDSFKQYFLIAVLTIFFVFITNFLPESEFNIMLIVNIFIIICIFLVLSIVFRFVLRKYRLSKVSKKDLDIIKKYYFIHKDWGLLSENKLYFSFECIDIVSDEFFKMKKKLKFKKDDLFDKDFFNQVKSINNKDIIYYYDLANDAVKCIYKYYDESGKRII